jgi:lipopolysaccharide transport system ATP-binding protein
MAHLKLKQASVVLPIFNSSSRSITNSILSAATGGLLTANKAGHVSIEALKNIDLEIVSGDRIGIVGHNGSGKSTLLRLLSGIYEPSAGQIEREGSISSLVDINLGINQESSGRENIFLRGKLMGLSHREITQKLEEIIEFSELGGYIDLPVRVYSSGMVLRLAFTVATSIGADILIMDEWLSMGDGSFAKRASGRLQSLVDKSEILIVASHSKGLIQRSCNKVVWLEHGTIKKIGPVDEMVAEYFGNQKD